MDWLQDSVLGGLFDQEKIVISSWLAQGWILSNRPVAGLQVVFDSQKF